MSQTKTSSFPSEMQSSVQTPKLKSTSIKKIKKNKKSASCNLELWDDAVQTTRVIREYHQLRRYILFCSCWRLMRWKLCLGVGVGSQVKEKGVCVGAGGMEGVQKTFCNPVTTKFSLVFSKHVDIVKITHFPTRPCTFWFLLLIFRILLWKSFICLNRSSLFIGLFISVITTNQIRVSAQFCFANVANFQETQSSDSSLK